MIILTIEGSGRSLCRGFFRNLSAYRTELWGYASDEQLSNDELIREQYSGIRPAPAIRLVQITPSADSVRPASTPKKMLA